MLTDSRRPPWEKKERGRSTSETWGRMGVRGKEKALEDSRVRFTLDRSEVRGPLAGRRTRREKLLED